MGGKIESRKERVERLKREEAKKKKDAASKKQPLDEGPMGGQAVTKKEIPLSDLTASVTSRPPDHAANEDAGSVDAKPPLLPPVLAESILNMGGDEERTTPYEGVPTNVSPIMDSMKTDDDEKTRRKIGEGEVPGMPAPEAVRKEAERISLDSADEELPATKHKVPDEIGLPSAIVYEGAATQKLEAKEIKDELIGMKNEIATIQTLIEIKIEKITAMVNDVKVLAGAAAGDVKNVKSAAEDATKKAEAAERIAADAKDIAAKAGSDANKYTDDKVREAEKKAEEAKKISEEAKAAAEKAVADSNIHTDKKMEELVEDIDKELEEVKETIVRAAVEEAEKTVEKKMEELVEDIDKELEEVKKTIVKAVAEEMERNLRQIRDAVQEELDRRLKPLQDALKTLLGENYERMVVGKEVIEKTMIYVVLPVLLGEKHGAAVEHLEKKYGRETVKQAVEYIAGRTDVEKFAEEYEILDENGAVDVKKAEMIIKRAKEILY